MSGQIEQCFKRGITRVLLRTDTGIEFTTLIIFIKQLFRQTDNPDQLAMSQLFA